MKKILHVIDSLGRGGAESQLVNILTSLPQFEHHLAVFSSQNDFADRLQQSNIIIHNLGEMKIWKLPLLVTRLRKLIYSLDPALVHSQLYLSNLIARLATPATVKCIFTNQSLQANDSFKSGKRVLLEKITYKKRHILISVSQVVENEYREFIGIKGPHFVLHNIANDNFFKGPKSEFDISNIRCVNVGRLHPQKNQLFLLKTFAALPDYITLDIYGTGPLEAELKSFCGDNGLKNVHLKGVQSNMAELLVSYDVFIMTSLYEGFSVALMEAMASGLPAVLPDLPVFREMGGNAALYFHPFQVGSLTAILEALTIEKLIAMSKASFAQASLLASKKAYLEKILAIYAID